MFLEECKYVVKETKVTEYITGGIEISSDEENSNEENSNEENSNKESSAEENFNE